MNTQQASAAVQVMSVLYQAIAAAGTDGIPSGHLYAFAMNSFTDVGNYEACVNLLVKSGLVKRENQVLTASVLESQSSASVAEIIEAPSCEGCYREPSGHCPHCDGA